MAQPSSRTAKEWIPIIAYWFFTIVIADEMIAGSMWDLLRVSHVRFIFNHLGYPLYLLTILGAWKLPCGFVLLLPRFPRLKEWAYAGAFFNYSGAAASHLLAGDGVNKWVIGTGVFAAMTLAGWALRPSNRRLTSEGAGTTRPVAWIVPLALGALMLASALLTLPKGVADPY